MLFISQVRLSGCLSVLKRYLLADYRQQISLLIVRCRCKQQQSDHLSPEPLPAPPQTNSLSATSSAYCIWTRVGRCDLFLPRIVTGDLIQKQPSRYKSSTAAQTLRKTRAALSHKSGFFPPSRAPVPEALPSVVTRTFTSWLRSSGLPLAEWISMSNKWNSTSFPTSAHIFRSWQVYGRVRWSEKPLTDPQRSGSVRLRSSVTDWVRSAPLAPFFLPFSLGCELDPWRLWAGSLRMVPAVDGTS